MEGVESTHYVSFLDDQMKAEATGTPSSADRQLGGEARPSSANGPNQYMGNASMFRKLLQSHRYKARLAAAVGFLAVLLFAGSFWYLRSVDKAENDIFPGGWTPDLRRRAAGSIGDASVWDIAGDPLEAWNWTEEQFEGVFAMWAKTYKKSYASVEERAQRFRVFKRNVIYIATHNSQGYSYTLKVNEFGDLTKEEFRSRYLGYRKDELVGGKMMQSVADELLAANEGDIPDHVDWREKGCVREVKDQGQCGSCWAFAATGSMEGAACAQWGEQVNLSEQQLVDCSGFEGTHGCEGGSMEAAFRFVVDNHGLCAEKDYPYTMEDDKCKRGCKPVIHLKQYVEVPHRNEKALRAAIAQYGPVSVSIEADQMPFQFYHDGIFDASCGSELDHGVLAVGYGTDKLSGKDYWIVKNSWGSKWGDHGYIKLARHMGAGGECGILLDASFPIVAKEESKDKALPPTPPKVSV